jgi:hypothetical protein
VRPRGRLLLGTLACLVALAGARVPLHLATDGLPVSNDDAIPLLMARHVLRGELATTLWNQPYNGALDAYLLAPALLVASPQRAFRVYEALCGLLLVAAVALLARRCFGPRATIAAALLAAVGTPYMALMAATGPTPNFLVPLLVAAVVLLVMGPLPHDAQARQAPGGGASRWRAFAVAGLVSGLAIWDSALALPALAGAAAGLLATGMRFRRPELAAFAAMLLLGLLPALVARWLGASSASPVTALRPRWLWADGLRDLAVAASGLVGLEIPLVIDGPERARLPRALSWTLATALGGVVVAGSRSRAALPLLGWGLGLAAAFAASRRTGADELRYLFGLVVPVLALGGAGLATARGWRRWPALAAGVAIAGCWWAGQRVLVSHWRDPRHAAGVWQVPPLEPVTSTLARAGVRSAYASLQVAGRLTLESDERVLASQAWNERIPGEPLRFRDEVDLDPRAAWVLSPHLSRGMPRASGFRALLGAMGGSWREDVPGDFVVFRSFRPPYDEARPVARDAIRIETLAGEPLGAAVLDRDAATAWISAAGIGRGSGLSLALDRPRRVSALVLALHGDRSPLAVPWIVEADGELVAMGPARHGLQWVNGAPRAGRQALLAIALGERRARAVRLVFQGPGPPLAVAEAFVYGPDEPAAAPRGGGAASAALDSARAGDWAEAVRLYAEAARLDPERASRHAALIRARWRAGQRRVVDVESLEDGGAALVAAEPPAR